MPEPSGREPSTTQRSRGLSVRARARASARLAASTTSRAPSACRLRTRESRANGLATTTMAREAGSTEPAGCREPGRSTSAVTGSPDGRTERVSKTIGGGQRT